jgi:hypothetical protein
VGKEAIREGTWISIDIYAGEITYFDPFTGQRLDGLAAVSAWYEPIRGQIQIERDEIVDPSVQRWATPQF